MKILKTEGTSLSRINGTLGRNLMFTRIKTMLEEKNVRSLNRIEKEELHTKQPTTLRGQLFRVKVSLPEQISF